MITFHGAQPQSYNGNQYIYVDLEATITLHHEDQSYQVTYQNGHSYVGNDYSALSNRFEFHSVWLDNKQIDADSVEGLRDAIEAKTPDFRAVGISREPQDWDLTRWDSDDNDAHLEMLQASEYKPEWPAIVEEFSL